MGFQEVITYIFSVLILAVPLFAIYKCLLNREFSVKQKALWVILSLIIPLFGGLTYLILFYKK
ncbi:PLDc N-terminal domain-containing protein [Sphingobacterium wenxiniae]|uniref:Phospholipase_D-nuclease N-terminal n=1 Tax=Sphingobacterium wenxiniae TaxID=683125 RepID=A0A1I6U5H0_9SPHI|nr:Phospholipase_D-nuclease N-terminal [Sphingobacterium wenxiniae]